MSSGIMNSFLYMRKLDGTPMMNGVGASSNCEQNKPNYGTTLVQSKTKFTKRKVSDVTGPHQRLKHEEMFTLCETKFGLGDISQSVCQAVEPLISLTR